jgi:hypothetical protein
MKAKLVIGLCAIASLLLLGLLFGPLLGQGAARGQQVAGANADARNEAMRQGAVTSCQQFIKHHLGNAEATSFGRLSTLSSHGARNGDYERRSFKVISYVNAPDGFGDFVRNHYTCVVRPVNGGKDWQLVELKLATR